MNGIEKIVELNSYANTYAQIANDQGIKTQSASPQPVPCTPQPATAEL